MADKEHLYKDVSSLECVYYRGKSADFDEGVMFILEQLDAIPEADVVAVKRGRWLDRIVVGREKLWFCSECDTMGSPQWKCCPVCTAFMDRKDESE